MEIFEFDTEERMTKIKGMYQEIKQIKESLSEKRAEYRAFSESVDVEFSALENCCLVFERTLLIECYTYSEQLIKNLVYMLLEKGTHKNYHINSFIENKISPEKFSPKVEILQIEKLIKEVYREFKFVLKSQHSLAIRKYDELVKSRHRYAHKGTYDYDFENFEEVILVLEYLKYEAIFIKKHRDKREKFQIEIEEMRSDIKKILTTRSQSTQEIRIKLKNIKKKSEKFEKNYGECSLKKGIFLETYNCLKELHRNLDLRRIVEAKSRVTEANEILEI